MFLQLSEGVRSILSVPHSSENLERIFSYQNITKNKMEAQIACTYTFWFNTN